MSMRKEVVAGLVKKIASLEDQRVACEDAIKRLNRGIYEIDTEMNSLEAELRLAIQCWKEELSRQ